MTPIFLQNALVKELEGMFKNRTFVNAFGEREPIKVYAQNLPYLLNDDDTDPFSYIIVRILNGSYTNGKNTEELVDIVCIVSIQDTNPEAQAHREILNIIQDIKERFAKNPLLDGRYTASKEFEWALEDDEYYPYAFGSCKITFSIPGIKKEDMYA